MWSLALPALKRAVPLRTLVAFMWTEGRSERSIDRESRIIELSANLTRLRPRLRSNCIEQSLLAYRFLARAGADPRIVLGVSTSAGGQILGHAWVTLDGEPVHEPRHAVDGFAPIVEFGARGEAAKLGRSGSRCEPPLVSL